MQKTIEVVFARSNWLCVASQLYIRDSKACGAESIVLRKAVLNYFLCQGSCVLYLLKQRTLSMHHVYLLKKTSLLRMYVTLATGEENYLSVSLLEPIDFVLQVNFVVVLCACTVCGEKSILLRKAAINDFLCQDPVFHICSNNERFRCTMCIC